ncbi:hypothetical protein M0812_04882 [Anaeramoeba flamelloides]|uniref:Uncharacterized protein n=1 Tax=Anaeramoeba flamelloides TaxID=1746091 RepID=A0AAV8AAP2_9EUKA|nr:hypothetical protein M0812_04882 [Anaeramoeba flamelloides]
MELRSDFRLLVKLNEHSQLADEYEKIGNLEGAYSEHKICYGILQQMLAQVSDKFEQQNLLYHAKLHLLRCKELKNEWINKRKEINGLGLMVGYEQEEQEEQQQQQQQQDQDQDQDYDYDESNEEEDRYENVYYQPNEKYTTKKNPKPFELVILEDYLGMEQEYLNSSLPFQDNQNEEREEFSFSETQNSFSENRDFNYSFGQFNKKKMIFDGSVSNSTLIIDNTVSRNSNCNSEQDHEINIDKKQSKKNKKKQKTKTQKSNTFLNKKDTNKRKQKEILFDSQNLINSNFFDDPNNLSFKNENKFQSTNIFETIELEENSNPNSNYHLNTNSDLNYNSKEQSILMNSDKEVNVEEMGTLQAIWQKVGKVFQKIHPFNNNQNIDMNKTNTNKKNAFNGNDNVLGNVNKNDNYNNKKYGKTENENQNSFYLNDYNYCYNNDEDEMLSQLAEKNEQLINENRLLKDQISQFKQSINRKNLTLQKKFIKSSIDNFNNLNHNVGNKELVKQLENEKGKRIKAELDLLKYKKKYNLLKHSKKKTIKNDSTLKIENEILND